MPKSDSTGDPAQGAPGAPELDVSQYAVVRREGPQLPTFKTPEHYIAFIEERDSMLTRLRPIVLKAVRPSQWTTYGSGDDARPRPDSGGALAMLRRAGGSVINPYFEYDDREDDEGPYYIYTCYGTFVIPIGTYIDIFHGVGTCSSRDAFLGKAGGEFKSLKDVKEDHVKKKAYSNMIVNGTLNILALKGLTWPELEVHGFRRDGSTQVEFKDKGKGGGVTKGTGKQQSQDNPVVEEGQRNMVIDRFMTLATYLEWDKKYETIDAVIAKYLAYRKPAQDGSTCPTLQKITSFKYQRAIGWLQGAIKAIEKNEDLSRFDDWEAQQEGPM